jgi:hypothetical protein
MSKRRLQMMIANLLLQHAVGRLILPAQSFTRFALMLDELRGQA